MTRPVVGWTTTRFVDRHLFMSHKSSTSYQEDLKMEKPVQDGADRSLAADFVVKVCRDAGYSWTLFQIDQSTEGKEIIAEGARAMDALVSKTDVTSTPVLTLSCDQSETEELSLSVSTTGSTIDNGLVEILQRIIVQWAAKEINPDAQKKWKVFFQDQKSNSIHLVSDEGLDLLFANYVDSSKPIEWVEMVTGNGEPLGKLPRRLVHSHNILHRGVGLFVTKDRAIDFSRGEFPDLYVHRRSATKRIFPSLYDMFVGGVSLADEPPELTARREVAEELGLSRALDSSKALFSDPILVCTVCTAYNRCVVTLFSYIMDTKLETVTWQEEEVDWGDFVPYPIIVSAADRSIQRFAEDKKWPGTYPPIQSEMKGSIPPNTQYNNKDWKEWDFVPDGLLVWEAWLRMLKKKEVC